jgi:hypothetical protein
MVDAGEDSAVADMSETETLVWSTERRRGLQLQQYHKLDLELVNIGSTGIQVRRRSTDTEPELD